MNVIAPTNGRVKLKESKNGERKSRHFDDNRKNEKLYSMKVIAVPIMLGRTWKFLQRRITEEKLKPSLLKVR